MKIYFLLSILILLTSFAGETSAQDKYQPAKNIILIGWDGAQRNHIYECLGRGELSNLKQLASEGALVDIDVLGVTDTKAGWSQILTGYNPEVTGVYSNSRYQPVPKGYSIFERLENHFGPENFVTVAVIGKKAHCGEIDPPGKVRLDAKQEANQPVKKSVQKAAASQPKGNIVEEDGVKYQLIPGSPYYNMYTVLDIWEFGLTQNNREWVPDLWSFLKNTRINRFSFLFTSLKLTSQVTNTARTPKNMMMP